MATSTTQCSAGKLFGPMSLSNDEFEMIRAFVYEHIGINLTEKKRNLVIGRLQEQVRSLGFGSFKHYYDYLSHDRTGQALDRLVNRISTNFTYFNRESDHFDFFRDSALPNIVSGMKNEGCCDLRMWCAGCSSGEEPYMLVMEMLEVFGREYKLWDAGILATDISAKALETAKSGVYSTHAVDRVPLYMKGRYFLPHGPGELKISDHVKREVTFRRFNLMNKQFPFKKPFQMIFCRNVMIYFDQPTREALVRKFYDHMTPGGYLFIGHSETLGRKQTLFDYVMPAVYRKKGMNHADIHPQT